MRTFCSAHTALGVCAMSALLVACRGGNPSGSGTLPDNVNPDTLPYGKTFEYTGAKQQFKVPSGVTSLTVVGRGAAGASNGCDSRFHGSDRPP
jgi:hypothetical protein